MRTLDLSDAEAVVGLVSNKTVLHKLLRLCDVIENSPPNFSTTETPFTNPQT